MCPYDAAVTDAGYAACTPQTTLVMSNQLDGDGLKPSRILRC